MNREAATCVRTGSRAAEDRLPLMQAHVGMLRGLSHGKPNPRGQGDNDGIAAKH
jgi:hypothetical protein